MCKKVFLILCSVILLGVLAGCGQDDYDDGRDDAPPPQDHRSGRISLLNDTSLPISGIYLRSSSEFEVAWGANILSTDLLPGQLRTHDVNIPDDSNNIIVDLKFATKYKNTPDLLYYIYYTDPVPIRIDACQIGTCQTVKKYAKDFDFFRLLEIVNDRVDGAYIERLYWSPKDLNTWSLNQITSGSIPPGDSIQLLGLEPGSYNIRVVWGKEPFDVIYEVTLSRYPL